MPPIMVAQLLPHQKGDMGQCVRKCRALRPLGGAACRPAGTHLFASLKGLGLLFSLQIMLFTHHSPVEEDRGRGASRRFLKWLGVLGHQ